MSVTGISGTAAEIHASLDFLISLLAVGGKLLQWRRSHAGSQTQVQIAAPFVVASSGAKANFLRRLCAALFKPVDISFLVFFRILFGGIMLWEVYRYFTHGWISALLR